MPLVKVTCSQSLYKGTHEWTFRNDDRLADFRQTVKEKFGVEAQLQRLMLSGAELTNDDKLLVDLKLGGKTVLLIVRTSATLVPAADSSAPGDGAAAIAVARHPSSPPSAAVAAAADEPSEEASAPMPGSNLSEEQLKATAIDAEYDADADAFVVPACSNSLAPETCTDNLPSHYAWRLETVFRIDRSKRKSVPPEQRPVLRFRVDFGGWTLIEGSAVSEYCVFGMVPGLPADSDKFDAVHHAPPVDQQQQSRKKQHTRGPKLLFTLHESEIDNMRARVTDDDVPIDYFAVGIDEGCQICHKRDRPEDIIICDFYACHKQYHRHCLKESPPDEEKEWYCPKCFNQPKVRRGAGEAGEKPQRRAAPAELAVRKTFGGGISNAGRNTECRIVPGTFFGEIPGLPVGTWTRSRMQMSELGIMRPPVGGISGRSSIGCDAIAINGGYAGDYDLGNRVTYTGAGGRDLSGNRRTTSEQSSDQQLNRVNLALARNCFAHRPSCPDCTVKVVDENGETTGGGACDHCRRHWRLGKPIRVVRGPKTEFGPKIGYRYDGIYKVIDYWCQYQKDQKQDNDDDEEEEGTAKNGKQQAKSGKSAATKRNNKSAAKDSKSPKNGKSAEDEEESRPDGKTVAVWRFLLGRDDAELAPWHKEYAARAEVLFLEGQRKYPEINHQQQADEASTAPNAKRHNSNKRKAAAAEQNTSDDDVQNDEEEKEEEPKSKKSKAAAGIESTQTPVVDVPLPPFEPYEVPQAFIDRIRSDQRSKQMWEAILSTEHRHLGEFLQHVWDEFQCAAVCPNRIVAHPITLECGHQICKSCFAKLNKASGKSAACPTCRKVIGRALENSELKRLLRFFFQHSRNDD